VASIRPSDGHLGIDMKTYPARLSATDCSLKQLIEAAYTVEFWQIAGGPAWLDADRFDIEAKTTEDLPAETDRVPTLGPRSLAARKMMLMLQTLLAERFNLKVHRETRQDNVFALVVAKGGPKLQPAKDTQKPWFISLSRGGFNKPDYDPSTAPDIITGTNTSMEQLAKYLEGNMRRPVLDQTGIKGTYDFRIEYAPDNSTAPTPPPFFTALQESTGLKLNTAKGPVEFLIVDHADKPPANKLG
jgi:uncharacterized protein (TIGR03435 family)